MIPIVALDANVVLHYFPADHKEFFTKAQILFQSALEKEVKLYIDEVIVAEVIWTLNSFHYLSKQDICSKLSSIISQSFIFTKNKKALLAAISTYEQFNVDYAAAWFVAISKARKYLVASFDSDFKKLKTKLYELR